MTSASAPSLRRLYFTRFAFALVWAALLATTASTLGPFTVALLVLYPLFDVAAAFADARAAKATDPVLGLYVTVAVSSLAAAGVAVAASTGIPGTLRVWGSWAIVSGLAQLSVALCRRKLGGQWPLVLGGAGSAVAGTTFLLQAGRGGAALVTVAGYAGLGSIFFLVSALRLTFRAGERIR
ncbi:hypothetical protein [Amycolatopsis lexingtonensis]|uniref:hypothetical protein n=1 Tax=Amycolatopsis lexingtonensis TaxID=218822 RepID=UPI003F712E25